MAKRTAGTVLQVIKSLAHTKGGASDCNLLNRFVSANDQAAFASLVRRHGAMVLGVCMRALPNLQDAEDACQATFLILAQKANRNHWQPSVANWLFTTARKVAANARVIAQRRASREKRAAVPESVQPVDQLTGRELLTALDEELDKLPKRYREPLVLCYLEGLTRDEAATQLGVPAATLKVQLERGRKRLGAALTHRGCALGTGLLALAATSPAWASPSRFFESVIAAAAGTPSVAVAAIAKRVAAGGVIKKTVLLFACLAALAAGLASASWYVAITPQGPAPVARDAVPLRVAEEGANLPATDNKDSIVYAGRVLGPDGRPVPGAKLYMTEAWGYLKEPHPSPEYATSGQDGRFEFTVPKAKFGDHFTVVAATAANYGAGWVEVSAGGKKDNLTVRLVKDDVPITGQIVDLEGKPVPGATVRVLQIHSAVGDDLTPWLEAARDKKEPIRDRTLQLERQYLRRYTIAVTPTVTTDADGRFRITGIGGNRLVRAHLDGPTIASQPLQMLTRPTETFAVTYFEGNPEYPRMVTTYYGSNFRHAAAPTKPIVGVVRDKDTKQPLANVAIRSFQREFGRGNRGEVHIVRTTTDADGRYRLVGMPKGEGYSIAAIPRVDQPFVVSRKAVPDSPGLDPVTVDIELKRGVWIEGKIIDKVTGKPLHGSVEYFSMDSNPHLGEYPGFDSTLLMGELLATTKEDGSYRIVGVPGPGLIGVYYKHDPYLRADEREDEFGTKEESLSTSPYVISFPSNYNALARIDPPKGAVSVRRDVTIDPGWSCTVKVLGPDGNPLAGVHSFGLTDWFRWSQSEGMKTAEFTVQFNPHRRSDFVFQFPEKGLIGIAKIPKEKGGTLTVQMQPGAAVSGRLVDADGEPRAGVELMATFRQKGRDFWIDFFPERIQTDREGRFRIEALLPGYEYRLSEDTGELRFGDTLSFGQTKDLGDVQMKPEESKNP